MNDELQITMRGLAPTSELASHGASASAVMPDGRQVTVSANLDRNASVEEREHALMSCVDYLRAYLAVEALPAGER